jgi:hypothetical protein
MQKSKSAALNFFNRFKLDGKESPLRVLTQYDFNELFEKLFAEWLRLDAPSTELEDELRLVREQKAGIWKNGLRAPLLAAKNVLAGINTHLPIMLPAYGFPLIMNTTKQPETEKSLIKKVNVIAENLNKLRAEKEKINNEMPTVTITVDDVTSFNKTKG